jgi:small subunit ribosomal protein S6
LKRYEGMFLFDSAVVREWTEAEAEVRRLMERIGGELLVCVKFDERKLAYEIDKRRRGLYVLTYFDADAERITDLERDARLSEIILRLLVLRAEGLTEEKLAELKAHPAETPLSPASSGDGRRDDGGRGPRRGDGERDFGDRRDRPDRRERRRDDEPRREERPAPEQPATATPASDASAGSDGAGEPTS